MRLEFQPRLPAGMIILLALSSGGCATLHSMRPADGPLPLNSTAEDANKDFAIDRFAGDLSSSIGQFITTRDAARNSEPGTAATHSDALRKYQDEGVALSDLYCVVYLRQVDDAANRLRLTRNATNDVGGLVSTILTTASSDARLIGSIATGFSFADASLRNYGDAFIPAPDIPRTATIVRQTRVGMAKDYRNRPPTSLVQVEQRLINYEWTCTPTGIRELLNQAISSTRATYNDGEVTFRAIQNGRQAETPVPLTDAADKEQGQEPPSSR